jgi:amidase
MSTTDLHYLTLSELSARLRSRELSPVEVTDLLLERIERLDGELRSFVTVLAESAREQAAEAEAEIDRGQIRGPLHGVPIGVKDLCATKGVRTTCGTAVLADWVPNTDATVVERLVAAGAVILGKLKLTEGAFAAHHPDVIPPVNPWSAAHWTGVSSSGSGVATAAGLCYGSLGTDTGGSIRFPSACNGLVGIKPTYGRVSRYGAFPLSDSLDHVGPITRSVADAATMLGVIAGSDPQDPTSRREPVPDYRAGLASGVRGVRVGIDETYCTEGVDGELSAAVLAAAEVLREWGAETREIEMPPIREVAEGWTPFTAVEAVLAHRATFPARAEEYGPTLRALLEKGLSVTGTEYADIQSAREIFRGRLAAVLEDVDLILCPPQPFPPPPLAAMEQGADSPEAVGAVLRFTAPFDFSGSPTITLPCGFSAEGLPLGLQLVSRHLEEELLCRVGFAYEQATDWHTRHPNGFP